MAENRPPSPLATEQPLARAAALFVLILGVLLWFDRHLGVGLGTLESAVIVGAAMGAFRAVLKLLDKLEIEQLIGLLTRVGRAALSLPVLLILYGLALVLALSYTSVTVPKSEADQKSPPARLTAMDRGAWSKTVPTNAVAGTSYYLVPTSPFGRSVRLELDGYLPSIFTVYPITGQRVDPARDLTRWPSLVLRLPPALFPILGGEKPLVLLKLSQTAGGKEGRALWCGPVDHKAVLLGPSRAIDPALVAGWREEVIALGLSEAQRAQTVIGWRQHEAHRLANPVAPGTALRADAINLNTRCIMATAAFALGAEGVHDQPMELSPTYADPSCTDSPAVRCPGDAPAGPDGG